MGNPHHQQRNQPVAPEPGPPPTATPVIIVLLSHHDTYVHEDHENANGDDGKYYYGEGGEGGYNGDGNGGTEHPDFFGPHGKDKLMEVAPQAGHAERDTQSHAFVYFELDKLIPLNATINSAILKLCLNEIRHDEAGRKHTVRRVVDPYDELWSEDGLEEFKKDLLINKYAAATASQNIPVFSKEEVCITFNVKSDIQAFSYGHEEDVVNLGWRISDEEYENSGSNLPEDDAYYLTRESDDPNFHPELTVIYTLEDDDDDDNGDDG